MKSSFPVVCLCGETFNVDVIGTQIPKSVSCPKCGASIGLVEPLGNVVGMMILGRAEKELKNSDWTLSIVLAAMALECDMAFLYMKWNKIDLMEERMPTGADEVGWEHEWRQQASINNRLNTVSKLLTGKSFNSFVSQTMELLSLVNSLQLSAPDNSPMKLFVEGLFHKRNRIVHYGVIDFKDSEANVCFKLATTLSYILKYMDKTRYAALEVQLRNRASQP